MHIVLQTIQYIMPERKNFLILAIGMGAVGIIIGAVTIWDILSGLHAGQP